MTITGPCMCLGTTRTNGGSASHSCSEIHAANAIVTVDLHDFGGDPITVSPTGTMPLTTNLGSTMMALPKSVHTPSRTRASSLFTELLSGPAESFLAGDHPTSATGTACTSRHLRYR